MGPAQVRWTGRVSGHLGLARTGDDEAALEQRRRSVVDLPWAFLHQVHGASVVTVPAPGVGTGTDADALVTGCRGAPLAVFTADCAPVALFSAEGIIGLAHAGWRGVAAGVLAGTVEAMRSCGATEVKAALGPCIHPGCYEFGVDDLDEVADALGPQVRSTTAWGTPALDLPAAVAVGLRAAGAELVLDVGACTACSTNWFSHRARADTARQATVLWIPVR